MVFRVFQSKFKQKLPYYSLCEIESKEEKSYLKILRDQIYEKKDSFLMKLTLMIIRI